ncbi:MAG: hypothetical protein HYR88_15905 [Verrucomicrobia bacterium]|nr:hypothetical protein [Verrucomicrobiota bacterium]MBI3870531.1 hypothetical protein [Verrucomicrobiota bacterium]
MKWIQFRRMGGKAFLIISGFMLAGCQTPDLRPFRDSTAQIHSSVLEAKDLFLEEQERVKDLVPDAAKATLEKQIEVFKTNWAARVNVMESMVKYASSLASVAEAPDKSKTALEGVGQSVSELAIAAGPYAPAVEGAKDIALELIDLANRVRAVKQLKKAVLTTDKDMQRVARILSADFGIMRRELEDKQSSIRNLMDDPLSQQLQARRQVEKRVGALAEKLTENLRGQPLNNAVGGFNQDMSETQKYLEESDKWYLPHKARVELAERQLTEHVKLFRDTEAALAQWGKAHGELTRALQEGLAPDWTLLRQSADRIEKSIRKITKQDDKP